ncbi:MAG: hypothetical protein V7L22_08150 [Nostoc sp.]|uniref:hypothetical protein n=1 Tax=Nostoc sp. TaxID=1180 RepID=UPI002FFC353B
MLVDTVANSQYQGVCCNTNCLPVRPPTMTKLDRVPVAQLPDKYGIVKSVIYDRINRLGIKPTKIGNKSYVSGEQLELNGTKKSSKLCRIKATALMPSPAVMV